MEWMVEQMNTGAAAGVRPYIHTYIHIQVINTVVSMFNVDAIQGGEEKA